MFNQTEFFSDKIKKITTSERVTKNGISLEEMKSIFKMFPINVASYEGVNTPADEMRTRMIEALQHPNQAVLVLYSRATAQQEGKGHWSPIAAYDAESDSFLLLDVAKYKYPPTWIPAEILIAAMQTKDPIGRPRGLIILQAPTETSDKKSCS